MTREEFHDLFKTPGPVVLPVIHVLDANRTSANIEVLAAEGAAGCFLINHDFGVPAFLPVVREVRAAWPGLWIGVNFLAVDGYDAFPVLGGLAGDGCMIDACWADDARIDEFAPDQAQAEAISRARAASGWPGLYFGGTAFKEQRPVDPADHEAAARIAAGHMDVVTTSGIATGVEAGITKIADFRRGVGDRPLALASGVTPENAGVYSDVDAFLVATGINHPGNFYDIDPARLRALMDITRELGGQAR